MNVIGIVQTDLNEFNILFENQQTNGQGGAQQGQQDQSGQGQQGNQNDESSFLSFLGDTNDSGGMNQQNGSGNGGQGQDQGNPQEMTVRIKGVPEGQRATFLQMYQIIQDANQSQELERNLTIVNRGDEQGQDQ